jgi:hypothetical protein
MINIFIIVNRVNGHKYLGYDERPLNKVWKEMLQKSYIENSSLYNTMRHMGTDRFAIKIVEEVIDNKLQERMDYWMERYDPEYNKGALVEIIERGTYKRNGRKWGIQRKKKPKAKRDTNVIKCRNIETGKLKTLHGWRACVEYVNGDLNNIKRAVKNETTAYGHIWWVYKRVGDIRKKVYGVNSDGHYTQIYDSISDAMRDFGGDDRGKGICTSIKWNMRWRGYLWYYAEQ